MLGPARGTALRTQAIRYRFERGAKPGPKEMLADRVPEIRKLLRTDMAITAIATHLGTTEKTLLSFIRRRRLCALKARRDFISLQRSLKRED